MTSNYAPTVPPLPPGFVIQGQQAPAQGPWLRYQQAQSQGSVPPLPPGFVIQGQQPAPPPAAGPWTKYQSQAQPEQQSWAQWAVDKLLFPHEEMASAAGQAARRAGQELSELPAALAEEIKRQIDLAGTHYRTLLSPTGLVDAPTPEQSSMYRQAVIDLLLTAGGGKLGQWAGKAGGELLKRAGRGWQTRGGAQDMIDTRRLLDMMTGGSRLTPKGAPATTSLTRELGAPAVTGAGAATLTDWMNPTGSETWDDLAAGVVGVGATGIAAREGAKNLLLGSPKWRAMVMGPSRGRAMMLLGGILGHYAAQKLEIGADAINTAVDQVARQLGYEPEPAPEPAPKRYTPGSVFTMPAPGETRRY